jgi:IS4 transposase
MKFDYLPLLTGTYGTSPVFYNIRYRIVRVRITEELVETLITNLPADQYPPEKLKELYAMRWGIETSFRSLKYTVGMLHFNSKKQNASHLSGSVCSSYRLQLHRMDHCSGNRSRVKT